MGRLEYCPLVGSICSKQEIEVTFQKNTFFVAEPFRPDDIRQKREWVIRNAVEKTLKENYTESTLKLADKEPTEQAIFCDICQKIQSCEYGIVELSGLNPNVLLELGMMLALGRPVFILIKRDEEQSIRSKMPSDIIWKRAITYDDFVDIEMNLISSLATRPHLKPKSSMADANQTIPIDKNYKSLEKWQSEMGKKTIGGQTFELRKVMKSVLFQYCNFVHMNPDQIVEDARHEAMISGGISRSHEELLNSFLLSLNSPAKAHNFWGYLKSGFYGHNGINLKIPRPEYTPEHSYEKLTTEQLRKICDKAKDSLTAKSWILANSYMGLDVGKLRFLKVEDFHTDKWSEVRQIYPVTIRAAVSGTFEYTTFIGLDAKTELERLFKEKQYGQQSVIWKMVRQGFISQFRYFSERAGIGIDSRNVQNTGLPRNFALITSKSLKNRVVSTLYESIPRSNWNLVDHMLGRKGNGTKAPLYSDLEGAYLQALPKLVVY